MRKLVITIIALVVVIPITFWGLPAFAQTHVATLIPGQPLSGMAAEQIITDSGLPMEKLPDGTTNELTRGRDAVNAYRYAHTMLYKNGWYRGISENHTPLLVAMVGALEKEGYTSSWATFEWKSEEVLRKFWHASDIQNAKEIGYPSLEAFYSDVESKTKMGKMTEANQLLATFDGKWK